MWSYEGKQVRITSVIQSVPTHGQQQQFLLSALKNFIQFLHNFFWSNKVTRKSKNWADWDKIYLHKQEEGLVFRYMFEVAQSMYLRLCMLKFSRNSGPKIYCGPILCGTSIVRSKYHTLCRVKVTYNYRSISSKQEKIKQFIWWKPKGGTYYIQFDNQTIFDPLFNKPLEVLTCQAMNDIEILLIANGWHCELMKNNRPSNIIEHMK